VRWPRRSPWWPPLLLAAAWFLLACPIANRALRGLDFAGSTRLMVIAIASLPVIGALRALVDARIAAAAGRPEAEPATPDASVSPAADEALDEAPPPAGPEG
jgi:HAMP domain-containing protein